MAWVKSYVEYVCPFCRLSETTLEWVYMNDEFDPEDISEHIRPKHCSGCDKTRASGIICSL